MYIHHYLSIYLFIYLSLHSKHLEEGFGRQSEVVSCHVTQGNRTEWRRTKCWVAWTPGRFLKVLKFSGPEFGNWTYHANVWITIKVIGIIFVGTIDVSCKCNQSISVHLVSDRKRFQRCQPWSHDLPTVDEYNIDIQQCYGIYGSISISSYTCAACAYMHV